MSVTHLQTPAKKRILIIILHVSFSARLSAPLQNRWSSAAPWITAATRQRTLSPPPHLPPAMTRPPGWSPATTASPQSTTTTSTAASRTVTACPTVGQANRRTFLPLNMHLTTTPQTIHTPTQWRRIILRGIFRWALRCVTMYYDPSTVLFCLLTVNMLLSKYSVRLDVPLSISGCMFWLIVMINDEWMEMSILWLFLLLKFIFIHATCCYK